MRSGEGSDLITKCAEKAVSIRDTYDVGPAVGDDLLRGVSKLPMRGPKHQVASGWIAEDGTLESFILIAGPPADDETMLVEYSVK